MERNVHEFVKDAFDIDIDIIHQRAEKSRYWQDVENFFDKVADKLVGQMTGNQLGWLEKIEKAMTNYDRG